MASLTTNEKIGIGIAIYGALLATINSIIQFVTHRKDRADVIVRARMNMVFSDNPDVTLVVITAINRGRRPVRIEGIAARRLDIVTNFLFLDIRPNVPHELTEGQSLAAYAPMNDDLADIETYFAYDSLNREYCHHLFPWYRRLISRYRRKKQARAGVGL
jgi:hypothetical protein